MYIIDCFDDTAAEQLGTRADAFRWAPVMNAPAIKPSRRLRHAALAVDNAVATPLPLEMWPQLGAIGLSDTARTARHDAIGGSDANIILSNDPDRIIRLWSDKRGETAPDDLTLVLPVMLGQWTEAFNRQWYEREHGVAVCDAGLVAVSPVHPWRRATLDGYIPEKMSVWEGKHLNAFSKPDEVLARYMPQLQHNMAVFGAENAVLSVIYGNHKWECYEIASDWLYQDDLLAAEMRFWECVQTGEQPVATPPPPPPKPVATREVSLQGNNAWAASAADWLANVEAARVHATAAKALKELVEDDVTRAFGHGLEAKRSKAGAITLKALAS